MNNEEYDPVLEDIEEIVDYEDSEEFQAKCDDLRMEEKDVN